MIRIILWVCALCLPLTTKGQYGQATHDSLKALALRPDPPRQQAEHILQWLWFIYRYYNVSYEDFPEQLDSLYQCCLRGTMDDPQEAYEMEARIAFFKGNSMMYIHPDTAVASLQQSARLSVLAGDSALIALSMLASCEARAVAGDSVGFAGDYSVANRYYPYVRVPIDRISFLNNIGSVCSQFGRYGEAAVHFFDGLDLFDEEGFEALGKEQRPLFHNIANVYFAIGDKETSLSYLQKAIVCAMQYGVDPSEQYISLAGVWIALKKYDEALDALLQAQVEGHSEYDLLNKVARQYLLATCYRNLGRPDTALTLARQASEAIPISQNAAYGTSALMELAYCHFATGDATTALAEALRCFQSFVDTRNKLGAVNSAELMVTIYKSLHQFQNAFKYSQLRFQYERQIELQQSNRQLAFGEFRRDNAAQQAKRDAEVEAQLRRQMYIRYGLYAGLGVLALVTFLLYNRYRFKRRTADQLEVKNAEIEAARHRAEKSEAFKARFLAQMSHEIRTPLHGISGFAGLLQDTTLTVKQHRWLQAIHQSTLRLRDVVNDILDISKLEAGGVTLRRVAFSPGQVALDVAETLQPKVSEKGIALQVDIDPDIPGAVSGDPTRLYQVLLNLAGNAVKFTDSGQVTLSLTLKEMKEPGTVMIGFAVTDTGIGIPSDRLESVFESFRQAEESTTARYGGTGLGLTIARDLVRLYGSDIAVQSEMGKGSTFSFSLLLPVADEVMPEGRAPQEDHTYNQSLRILIVDDNAFNREIAMEALKRHFKKAEVGYAIHGREAIEQVQSRDFDLVLMDMQMPEMSGVEATRHIRKLEGNKRRIPIIALTASATSEEIREAIDAGMNRHLGKPFQPAELANVIAEVLKLE